MDKEIINFTNIHGIAVTDSTYLTEFPSHWHNAAEFTIVQKKGTKYRIGDTAEFTILYEGKPLANSKIITYCDAWQDLKPVNTDAEGKIRIPVNDKGSYVVIAKHTDTTKCSEDFDETGFSTTLLVEAE